MSERLLDNEVDLLIEALENARDNEDDMKKSWGYNKLAGKIKNLKNSSNPYQNILEAEIDVK